MSRPRKSEELTLDSRFDEKFTNSYGVLDNEGWIKDEVNWLEIKSFIHKELADYQERVVKVLEGMKRIYGEKAANIVGTTAELNREYNKALQEAIEEIKKLEI